VRDDMFCVLTIDIISNSIFCSPTVYCCRDINFIVLLQSKNLFPIYSHFFLSSPSGRHLNDPSKIFKSLNNINIDGNDDDEEIEKEEIDSDEDEEENSEEREEADFGEMYEEEFTSKKRKTLSILPIDKTFSPSLFLSLIHANLTFEDLRGKVK
jgi:hypothetical protein